MRGAECSGVWTWPDMTVCVVWSCGGGGEEEEETESIWLGEKIRHNLGV